jgi:GntR family transcriptional regulator, transcriptional repressor for pyruvate dehydrogenase complex
MAARGPSHARVPGATAARESGMKIRRIGRAAHLPAQVAGEIAAQIMSGRIKPGERLPTEPQLASRFGVSRTVVREAIARLRSEGVVRSKQGAGVFVIEAGSQPTLRIDRELLHDRSHFRNLFELRAMLEIHTAGLAAERRDEPAIVAIAAALQHLQGVPGSDPASVDADLDFHGAIAQATGNTFIAAFIRFISSQIRESIVATRRHTDPEKSVRTTYAEHAAIYEAIRQGDPAAARRAMRKHIAHAMVRLGV